MNSIPRRAGALLAGAVTVAALTACGPQLPAAPAVSTLQINVLGYMVAANWNPATSTYLNTYFQPQQAVYETLVTLNTSTFEWDPLLAESYEIDEDQLSMELKLREDVDFTDGTHFDAEAAKTSFDAGLAGFNAGFAELYGIELEVTSEYELEVRTTKAMGSDFMYQFGIVPIVSPTALEEDPTGLETTPVGTGPYILEEQIAEVSATFVRNPDYRNPEAYPFDEVEFIVFDDPVAAANALKSGQINAANINPSVVADVESSGFDLHLGPGSNQFLVWTDTDGELVPPLADVRVRQAIAFSFDRAAIIDTIEYGFGEVTSQVWGPGSPSHVEGGDDRYAFDPDRARELMADAGYEDGFALTLPTYQNLAKYEPIVMQALADIGITVTFDQYADVFAYSEATAAGKYALSLRGASDLFVSGSMREVGKAGYTALADLYEIVDTGTVDEAAEALQEIGRLVLDDALAIEVSRPSVTWASIPEITVDTGIVNWPVTLVNFGLAD